MKLAASGVKVGKALKGEGNNAGLFFYVECSSLLMDANALDAAWQQHSASDSYL